MAKTRFSISVDVVYADRIKAAAAHAGLDVSAYMWNAALEAADRDERVANIFTDVDTHIGTVEAESTTESWPPPPVGDELSNAERAEITARWNAFFNAPTRGVA